MADPKFDPTSLTYQNLVVGLAPPSRAPTPPPPPQQPSNNVGEWNDGCVHCVRKPRVCLCATFCTPWRWAVTTQRSEIGLTDNTAALFYLALWLFGLFGLAWVVYLVQQVVFDDYIDYVSLSFGGFLLFGTSFCLALLGGHVRTLIRRKTNIPGNHCYDFWLHWCCRTCVVAQEARHVDASFGRGVYRSVNVA